MSGNIRTVGVCGAVGTMGAGIAIVAAHDDICTSLFETYGTPAYAPARRAVVANMREERS
jgi:3-hydroxyacyl-CoA dehydrogenase